MSDTTPPTPPPVSDVPTGPTIAPQLQPAPPDPRGWVRSLVALLVMCAAVIAVYVPAKEKPGDNQIRGGDFHVFHSRRIAFARENLSSRGTIPAWYPREAYGSPFWANIQNFPFIPTRIPLLLVPIQHVSITGVMIAAVLSAVFTFLFGRAIGLGPVAAAVAGWTFACAGYFASRVATGQLSLLEAYPALPLLLWLVEINFHRSADDDEVAAGNRRQRRLIGLAFASMCVALAGHPQLGAYAFLVAGLYLVWRGWGMWRTVLTTGVTIALGFVGAAFALWPAMLVVSRSTRTLQLERGETDIVYPYGRLAAWLLPWKDGWPKDVLPLDGGNLFHGFPNDQYFYETVTFMGWLPLIAVAFLVARLAVARRLPGRAAAVLALAGTVAMLTALPWAHREEGLSSFTFLRSPARQTYVTTFALAVALGMAADVVLRRFVTWARSGSASEGAATRMLAAAALVALLVFHVATLVPHDRRFLRTIYINPDSHTALEDRLKPSVNNHRVAFDLTSNSQMNRRFDDVGFFDSLVPARSYRTIMDLVGAPPTANTQNVDASIMKVDRLAEAGARLVLTPRPRFDLRALGESGDSTLYRVPSPVARATFLPVASVQYVAEPDEMHRRRRAKEFDPWAHVMLPPDAAADVDAAKNAAPATTQATTQPVGSAVVPPSPSTQPSVEAAQSSAGASAPATGPTTRRVLVRGPTLPAELTGAEYERPSSDEIIVRLRNKPAGVLRVMESFDPGWEAEVNNLPVKALLADDAFLAVALPPGDSIVRFTYRTPGAMTGRALSVVALIGLFGLLWSLRPPAPEVVDEEGEDIEDDDETESESASNTSGTDQPPPPN
jgi:hypothetical protein